MLTIPMKNHARTISANLVHAMHAIQSPKQPTESEATAMEQEVTGILIRDAGEDHKTIQFKYGDEKYEFTIEKPMLVEEGIVCCVEAHRRLAKLVYLMVEEDEGLNASTKEMEGVVAPYHLLCCHSDSDFWLVYVIQHVHPLSRISMLNFLT